METTSPEVKPLISTHTFAFSFHLIAEIPSDVIGYNKDLEKALKPLFTSNDTAEDEELKKKPTFNLGHWNASDFTPWSSAAAFNEYQYFYKQVLETIYSSDNQLSKFGYAYRIFSFTGDDKERLFDLDLQFGRQVSLDIDEIHLSIVHVSGKKYTGVLTLHTSNRREDQSDPELILQINQQARHLYPSTFTYEGKLKPGVGLDLHYVTKKDKFYTDSIQEGLDSTILGIPDKATFLGQDWQQWLFMPESEGCCRPDTNISTSHTDHRTHATIPAVVYALIRSGFHSMLQTNAVDSGEYFPRVYAVGDARMHVHSYIGDKHVAGEIAVAAKNPPFNFSWRDSFPYRAVYVDERWPTFTYSPMLNEKLKQQTDLRWAGYGTLYGFTGYSSIMLSNSYENLGYNGYLVWVFRGAYYTMVQTVLLQRSAIRLLAQEVSRFHTGLLSKQGDSHDEKLTAAERSEKIQNNHKKVIELSESFTRFRERLVFTQVTSQDQGIDYYNHLQHAFGIRALLDELESELQFMAAQSELQYNYEQAIDANRRAEAAEKQAAETAAQTKASEKLNRILFYLTAIAIVPSLMIAFYSLNVIGIEKVDIKPWIFVGFLLFAVVVASYLAYRMSSFYALKFDTPEEEARHETAKKPIWWVLAMVVVVIMLAPLLFSTQKTTPPTEIILPERFYSEFDSELTQDKIQTLPIDSAKQKKTGDSIKTEQ